MQVGAYLFYYYYSLHPTFRACERGHLPAAASVPNIIISFKYIGTYLDYTYQLKALTTYVGISTSFIGI